MKKIISLVKEKALRAISVGLIIYPILAVIWKSLPEDITSLIPQYTDYIALVTGGSSAVLGTAGLQLSTVMSSSKIANLEIFNGLNDSYNLLGVTVDKNTNEIANLKNEFIEIKNNQERIESNQQEIITLLKANIEIKLSNPLIKDKAEEIRNKLFGDKNEV